MTAPHRIVNGETVLLTSEEIADRAAEEAAYRAPVPSTVTRTQALLALLDVGITEAQILAQIDGMVDATEKERARIRFHAQDWKRDSELIALMAAAFGISDQVDALFVAAKAQ